MGPELLDTPQAAPAAIRGGVVRVGGYVLAMLLSAVSAAVVLRYLGPAGFGRYAAIFSLMAIVSGLTEAGTANLGVREYAVLDRPAAHRMLAALQGLRLALATGGALVAVLFVLAAGYDDAMVHGAALAGAGAVITAAGLGLLIPLQAELRLVAVTGLEVLRQVATVAVLLALTAGSAGLALLLATPVPVGVVLLAAAWLVVRRSTPVRVSLSPARWRELLREVLPYAAGAAVGVLYSYVTILVLSLSSTDAETGLFGAGHRVFVVLVGVPGLVVAAAFPLLARAAGTAPERVRGALQRLFDVQLVVGAGMAIVAAAAAPAAIDVLAGPDYRDAVPILRIQAVALLPTALIALGGFALLSLKRYRPLLVVNAVALVAATAATVVGVRAGGGEGAAVALVAGELVVVAGYWSVLARSEGLLPELRVVPRLALAAAAAAVPAFALGLPSLVAATLAGVVYAGLALVLGTVPREVPAALLRRGHAP